MRQRLFIPESVTEIVEAKEADAPNKISEGKPITKYPGTRSGGKRRIEPFELTVHATEWDLYLRSAEIARLRGIA